MAYLFESLGLPVIDRALREERQRVLGRHVVGNYDHYVRIGVEVEERRDALHGCGWVVVPCAVPDELVSTSSCLTES